MKSDRAATDTTGGQRCFAAAYDLISRFDDRMMHSLRELVVGAATGRVLRPNGIFRFIEHVRAEGTFHGKIQEMLTPVWRWFGAGSHLNCEVVAKIKSVGFEITELQQRHLPLILLIIGAAKPGN